MKKYLPYLAIGALALTGCTSGLAPEKNSPSPATPVSSSAASSPSISSSQGVTPSETSSPTQTLSTAEEFSGTTLKGNPLQFSFFNSTQQDYLNNLIANKKKMSWGVLCSPTATADQLQETGVSVNDPDGDKSVLRSMKYATQEISSISPGAQAAIANMLETVDFPNTQGMNCAGVVSEDGEVSKRSYREVTAGQYVGTVDLLDTVELARK